MKEKTIVLSVARRYCPERLFVFRGHARCVIGRASDCDIRVPSDASYADVSHHHCSLLIDSSRATVRDLGSLNGTFVNGKRIGRRDVSQSADAADPHLGAELELHDGDEVRVGQMFIRVNVEDGQLLKSTAVVVVARSGETRLCNQEG